MVLGKQQHFSAVPVRSQAKPEYSWPSHHLGHRYSRSFQTAPPCGSRVFFYIEGAYDVTWRHGVLMKSYNYGIRGAMGYFLQNFLRDRSFRVRIGSILSDRFTQDNGVPQGGVLSVALFALMINDIANSIPLSIGRSLFVDDFAIWCVSRSTPAMERQLQLAVTRLERWATLNGFRFSTAKTKAMHFCRSRGNCVGAPLRHYGAAIPLDSSVRFLVPTMDSRLTYKEHFKLLKEKYGKVLNVLKCVSRTTYGSDRATLLLLYSALLRSKLDYACIVYDGACKSGKRTLNTIHNAALRTVTGAFRTSPTSSILAEAHEPPLAIRRCLLSMRYACKLRQYPDHPTYNSIYSPRLLAVFQNGRLLRAVLFCVRVQELLQEAGVRLRGIATVAPSHIPPWELSFPSPDVELAKIKKSDITPAESKARALEHLARYQRCAQYYTDGSKTEGGVGCAFVSNLTVRSFSLPGHATVFTAELVAIHKALCFIDVSDCLNSVIFTDSLSSLWALNDFNTCHPILQDILFLLTSFGRTGKTVEFCWIPSHVGVAGNERADEAAKRAAGAQCTRFLPLPARDSFSVCSTYARQKWQGEWEDSGQSKLKAIKPRLAPWQSSLRTSRIEEWLCAAFASDTPSPPTVIFYVAIPDLAVPAVGSLSLSHTFLFRVTGW